MNNERFLDLLSKANGPVNSHAGHFNDREMIEARFLIEQGLDYDLLDDEGNNVFTCLIGKVNARRQLVARRNEKPGLTESMVANGFNPLRSTPHNQRQLFLNQDGCLAIEGNLAIKEAAGCGLRDKDGNSFYHAFAYYSPENFLKSICAIFVDSHIGSAAGCYLDGRKLLVLAVNGKGQTPLHTLWSHGALAEGLRDHQGEHREAKERLINENCATATWCLHLLGADLAAVDKEGLYPLDGAGQRNLMGMTDPHAQRAVDLMRALTERRQLDKGTTQAKGVGRAGARL